MDVLGSMAVACARRRIRGRPVVHGIHSATAGARESAGSRDVHTHVWEPTALPRGARDGGGHVPGAGGGHGGGAGSDTEHHVPRRVDAGARVRGAQLGHRTRGRQAGHILCGLEIC